MFVSDIVIVVMLHGLISNSVGCGKWYEWDAGGGRTPLL